MKRIKAKDLKRLKENWEISRNEMKLQREKDAQKSCLDKYIVRSDHFGYIIWKYLVIIISFISPFHYCY